MALVVKQDRAMMRCLQHQKDFKITELSIVLENDRLKPYCPLCLDEIPAEYAQEIGGQYGICVVHEKEMVPAVARCSVCHNPLCGDCMAGRDACVFCESAPFDMARA